MDLRITDISFRDFRSYESFHLGGIGPLTVLVGPNAIGKTNVVEGIQLLTAQSSFRHPTGVQLVREGASLAQLSAEASDGNRQLTLGLAIEAGKRRFTLNGKPKRAVDLKGVIPSVAFTPDDLELAKGSMTGRRNALDGVDIDTGIGTADDAGNVLSSDVFYYDEASRSYYALNVAVTADNYEDFLDSTVTYAPVSNQLDATAHPTKNVWLNIYNSADNFLGSTYQPLLQKYDDLLNLNVEYIAGDGQTESNITNRLGNPDMYDAFAINMVKTDNAASYTGLLSQ